MPVVVFVAPYFSVAAKRFIHATASLPEVTFALVSEDPIEYLPDETRALIRRHVRVKNAIETETIVGAARQIQADLGPIDRLLATIEQIQVPLAEARAELGLPGLTVEQAQNFRDKTRMKNALRAAGVPVARHRQVGSVAAALAFAGEVGYPLVVKPPAGVASQDTFRATDDASLKQAVAATSAAGAGEVLLEEFVTGDEFSFDAFVLDGQRVFHSISRYLPAPLTVMENPWIQWTVLLPRELDVPAYDPIVAAGTKTLSVLGLRTGICHLEWFRRRDGSVVVSEVAARPPGAQITTMISRAHDVDCVGAWARLSVFDQIDPFPPRKYAVGAAFLRAEGQGRIRAVHGLDVIGRELGHLVTDHQLPQVGHEKSRSYEGEGFLIVRHPETQVVEDALQRIVSTVKVELG